jgi:t-SNARE complex subunit (syntaxin)
MTQIEGTFESAWEALIQARTVARTLNVEKVEQMTKKADEKSNEVIRSADKILKEFERRKEGVIFVLAILILIIVIISIYYFRAKRRRAESVKE